jgi:histidyl-tRNA synthetase
MMVKGRPADEPSVTAQRPIERLRGMDDLLPAAARPMQRALTILSALAEAHGYQPVDVPLLEPAELFLRKSGEALASKLYAFTSRGREVCVRPEFTASVGRLFVEHLQNAPLPQRLYYYGPVLRHEKPQRGKRRQSLQWGLELIGVGGALADAEIIMTACEGLDALGIAGYRVVLGHIGATLQMLSQLKLDRRARHFLLVNLENLSRPDRGAAYVEARLAELFPERSRPGGAPACLTAGADREEARRILVLLLEQVEANLEVGLRPADEVIEGILDQMARADQVPLIRQALALVEELAGMSGPPAQALPAAAALLARHSLSPEPLRELERVVALLRQAGLPEERLMVNLGFGRGLHYYTGMVFEIFADEPAAAGQPLCGGGRYDDLLTALGARRKTPACGFSYWVGRLAECLPPAGDSPPAEVLLGATTPEAEGAALRLARQMRAAGRRVELDLRGRSGAQHAARAGIRYVLTVSEAGERGVVGRLRDRRSGAETELDEAGLLRWAASRLE